MYKIVKFSLLPHPTASHFAKPLCKRARYFCQLACKEDLSVTDLFIIEDIGFHVKIFAKKR